MAAAVLLALVLATALDAFGAAQLSTVSVTGRDATANSTATESSRGSTAAGDTIDWVVSYRNTSDATGDVTIKDPITGNQEFVPGSLRVPAGFASRWSTDGGATYAATEPASGVDGIGAVGKSIPGSTGAEDMVTNHLTTAIPGSGSGDGWEALFVGGNVYNINHHAAAGANFLECHVKATGDNCPGFPTYVSPTAGDALGTGPKTLSTAQSPTAAVVGSRVYFPVLTTTLNDSGVACVDLQAQQSCGYTKLPPASGNLIGGMTGGATIAGRYYLTGTRATVYCFDPATSALCPGFPLDGSVNDPLRPNATAHKNSHVVAWDDRHLFGTYSFGSALHTTCVDVQTKAACPGFPVVSHPSQNTLSANAVLVPILDAGGAVAGVCQAVAPASNKPDFACYDMAGHSVPTPFASVLAGGGYVGWGSYQDPAVVGSRVYMSQLIPPGNGFNNPDRVACWDYATSSACQGFVQGSSGAVLRPYTVRQDPGSPDCLWQLGDADKFETFSATFGGTNCNEGNAQVQLNPADSYCDGGTGHVTGWDRVSLAGVAAGEYDGAAVTITDANGNAVAGWDRKVVSDASQTIDISSIPYGGSTTQLKVTVVINWGSHTPKPVTVRALWAGDAPQLCFQTKVDKASCSATPAISNTATAVTDNGSTSDGPDGSSSPTVTFTQAADASLCRAALSIKKTAATDPVPQGGNEVYTVTVSNAGPDAAKNVIVTDALPGDLTYVSADPACSYAAGKVTCTAGEVPSGGSQAFNITARVSGTAASPITNTATVTTDTPTDQPPAPAEATVRVSKTTTPQPQSGGTGSSPSTGGTSQPGASGSAGGQSSPGGTTPAPGGSKGQVAGERSSGAAGATAGVADKGGGGGGTLPFTGYDLPLTVLVGLITIALGMLIRRRASE